MKQQRQAPSPQLQSWTAVQVSHYVDVRGNGLLLTLTLRRGCSAFVARLFYLLHGAPARKSNGWRSESRRAATGSPRLRGSIFFHAATFQPFLFPSFHKVMLYVYFVAHVDSPYTPERPHLPNCLGQQVETSIENTSNPLLTFRALVMGIQQGHNEGHGYSTMKFDPLTVGGTDGSRLPGRVFIPIPGSRENRVLFKAF